MSSVAKKAKTRNVWIILAVCMLIGCTVVILIAFLLTRGRRRGIPTPAPGSPSPAPGSPSPAPGSPSPAPSPAPAAPNPSAPSPTVGSPVPSVPSVPSVPPAPSSRWASVKAQLSGENKNSWSSRIYNAVTGGASSGEDPATGGKNYNVQHCGLNQINTLTKPLADCFCKNPCYYYGTKYGKSAELAAAGMCDCSREVAINF